MIPVSKTVNQTKHATIVQVDNHWRPTPKQFSPIFSIQRRTISEPIKRRPWETNKVAVFFYACFIERDKSCQNEFDINNTLDER